MNTPQDWGITLSSFDGPNEIWGRNVVANPRINSGSLFYDNLPIHMQRGLLDSSGNVDQTKLNNLFLNKAQNLISGIVRVRKVLRSDVFALLSDDTQKYLKWAVLQAIDFLLRNTYAEQVAGNNISTGSLTISDNLTNWLTSSSMQGTEAWTSIMLSGIHLYEWDGTKLTYDGTALKVAFKSGELLKDTEIDTANVDSLLTRKEITKAIGNAVSASRVEIFSSNDIDILKTGFDAFIKANATGTHNSGEVVDIVYTGTDTKYIKNGQGAVESYVYNGTNYLKLTTNIATIDSQALQDAKLSTMETAKANKTEVILKDGSNDMDANYTPTNAKSVEVKDSVESKIAISASAIKGNNATKTITELEIEDTNIKNRLNALETTTLDKFAKGKWEINNADISANNSPTATSNIATFAIPTVDNSSISITRAVGDISHIIIELPSTSLGTLRKAFVIEYGATRKDLITVIDTGAAAEAIEAQFNNNVLTITRSSGSDVDFSNILVKTVEQDLFIAKTDMVLQPELTAERTRVNNALATKLDKQQAANVLVPGGYKGFTSTTDVIAKINEHTNFIGGYPIKDITDKRNGLEVWIATEQGKWYFIKLQNTTPYLVFCSSHTNTQVVFEMPIYYILGQTISYLNQNITLLKSDTQSGSNGVQHATQGFSKVYAPNTNGQTWANSTNDQVMNRGLIDAQKLNRDISDLKGTTANKRYVITSNENNVPSLTEEALGGGTGVQANSYIGRFSSFDKFQDFTNITTAVANQAFLNESNLKVLNMPLVQTVGDYAFEHSRLTSLSLPLATSIGGNAFYTSRLTSLSLPKATNIEIAAFTNSRLTSLSLPLVTSIGDSAFYNIVNSSSTHVTMKAQFNTSSEKDRIFGSGHWSNITFSWV